MIYDKIKIYVIDNAQTNQHKEFESHPNTYLIYNKNLGGSGGFTRGLLEAKKDVQNTHFLLMDDDIILSSESIFRSMACASFSNQDISIGGAMLDAYKMTYQYESGANFRAQSLNYQPLNKNLNLLSANILNMIAKPFKFDYTGWWYFIVPNSVISKIGFPIPCFVLGDDSEYSIRIQKSGKKITMVPGIAVWHEPFYLKTNLHWMAYYTLRNLYLLTMIHYPMNDLKDFFIRFYWILRRFIGALFFFNYTKAHVMLHALEQIFKGPTSFMKIQADEFHKKLMQINRNQTVKKKSTIKYNQDNGFKRFFLYCTINGHLMPHFLLNNQEVIREKSKFDDTDEIRVMNRSRFFCLFAKFLWVTTKLFFRRHSVHKQWRKEFPNFTSEHFWLSKF